MFMKYYLLEKVYIDSGQNFYIITWEDVYENINSRIADNKHDCGLWLH